MVSVIVPVFNPEPMALTAMIASVQEQVYDAWELCLADDRSTDPRVAPVLAAAAAADRRVRFHVRDQNGNIAAASNTALEMSRGEFVALVDHDDVLRPHALHSVVAALQADRDVDVIYSDEDKILLDGRRGRVNFKGDFDPDHLLSTNYVSHLSVLRRSLVGTLPFLGENGCSRGDDALIIVNFAKVHYLSWGKTDAVGESQELRFRRRFGTQERASAAAISESPANEHFCTK
jgi:glycosyltransferase involved in cell wall biosynthesis